MNPAEIVLVLLALAGSGWAAARYWALSRAERERRRRERQGMRNAAAERATAREVCVICGEPIAADQDYFDRASASWWHRGCWQRHVREETNP